MSKLTNSPKTDSNNLKKTLKQDLGSIDVDSGIDPKQKLVRKISATLNYLKTEVKRSSNEPPPNTSGLALFIKMVFWAFVIISVVSLILALVWRLTGEMSRQDWITMILISLAGLLVVGAPLYFIGYMLYKVLSSEYVERPGFIERISHNTDYAWELRDACGENLLKQVSTYLRWQVDTQLDVNAHIAEFLRGTTVLFVGMLVIFDISPEAREFKIDVAGLAAFAVVFILIARSIVTARVLKLRFWLSIVDQAVSLELKQPNELVHHKVESKPSVLGKIVAFLRLN